MTAASANSHSAHVLQHRRQKKIASWSADVFSFWACPTFLMSLKHRSWRGDVKGQHAAFGKNRRNKGGKSWVRSNCRTNASGQAEGLLSAETTDETSVQINQMIFLLRLIIIYYPPFPCLNQESNGIICYPVIQWMLECTPSCSRCRWCKNTECQHIWSHAWGVCWTEQGTGLNTDTHGAMCMDGESTVLPYCNPFHVG